MVRFHVSYARLVRQSPRVQKHAGDQTMDQGQGVDPGVLSAAPWSASRRGKPDAAFPPMASWGAGSTAHVALPLAPSVVRLPPSKRPSTWIRNRTANYHGELQQACRRGACAMRGHRVHARTQALWVSSATRHLSSITPLNSKCARRESNPGHKHGRLV